jgi:protein required for attachment to host cells
MRIRIVVANQAEARFYDTLGPTRTLVPAGSLRNPLARLHDQDLESDRPGRVFNFAAAPGKRRGASPRHGANGERSTHQHIIEKFARRIGDELRRAHAAGRFDRLVLMAAPAFLGRLRRSLPAQLRPCIAATVIKDLVNQPDADFRDYLPNATFARETGFRPVKRATRRSA